LLGSQRCLDFLDAVDYKQATALQYSIVMGRFDTARLLVEAGASPRAQSSSYVPSSVALIAHHLRLPPWFVIQGDFPEAIRDPGSKRNCPLGTCNISTYQDNLHKIKGYLLSKGTIPTCWHVGLGSWFAGLTLIGVAVFRWHRRTMLVCPLSQLG